MNKTSRINWTDLTKIVTYSIDDSVDLLVIVQQEINTMGKESYGTLNNMLSKPGIKKLWNHIFNIKHSYQVEQSLLQWVPH